MGQKENDGAGAKRMLTKKIMAILVPFSFLIILVTILRSPKDNNIEDGGINLQEKQDYRRMRRPDNLREEMHEMHDRHGRIEMGARPRYKDVEGHERLGRDQRGFGGGRREDMEGYERLGRDKRGFGGGRREDMEGYERIGRDKRGFGGGRREDMERYERPGRDKRGLGGDHGYEEHEAGVSDRIQGLLDKGSRLTDPEKLELINTGSVNLIDLSRAKRRVGTFCRLRWEFHKADPNTVPMFRELVAKSPRCKFGEFDYDFQKAVESARKYDEREGTTNVLTPNGFVFHESRCGSTLVANSLAAFSPQLTRVYSESTPALNALTSCGENYDNCGYAKELVQDVLFMMGRTDNPSEKYMFFKIQSAGTNFMRLMEESFPETPWIFVYRDPVEVMMSHLDVPEIRHANCLRSMRSPSPDIKQMIQDSGEKFRDLELEEHCAVHLANLCQSALDQIYESNVGHLVNYNELPDALISYVIPNHFNVPLSQKEVSNILRSAAKYSKGSHNRDKEWEGDSEKKQSHASDAVLRASNKWLLDIYNELEEKKNSLSHV